MNKLAKLLYNDKNIVAKTEKVLKGKGYLFFPLDRAYDVNLIFVRSNEDINSGTFNDACMVIFSDFNKVTNIKVWDATTDPGVYYREHMANKLGCGIIAPGQYRKSLAIGMHKGYEALVHTGPIKIYRDNNGDGKLDFMNPQMISNAGFNVHGTKQGLTVDEVGKFSAGCQVIRYWENFLELMRIMKLSAGAFGNNFTRTILESKDFGL